MRVAQCLTLSVLLLAFTAGGALAFHDAGVADCAGCHTMHNSEGDTTLTDNGDSNPYLLMAANATDACLSCHAGYGQMADGKGYGPGGDFAWITKTFTWSAHGRPRSSEGDNHGHNVISPGYLIERDATLDAAPGGDFSSLYLTCTSCHDPHGNQNFRLLYGTEMGPLHAGVRYGFSAPAPLAVGNSRRTISEDGWETDASHTVYKSGMSEWCGNCHTDIHSAPVGENFHDTGVGMGSTVAAIYNAYVSSDDIGGGGRDGAYFGLVPFEDVDINLAAVDSVTYLQGPDPGGSDQVMCLTCHRSHASAFTNATRWDMNETFLAESHPSNGGFGNPPSPPDGGMTSGTEAFDSYYGDNYAWLAATPNQRSLCNKCHAKDRFDAPF